MGRLPRVGGGDVFIIGVMGRIGAGKSTVARLFAERGASVIDADAIAHEILDAADVRRAIAGRFGPRVLDASGRVNRPALAGLVFGDGAEHATALRDLEAIVHPRVHDRIGETLSTLRRAEESGGEPAVVVLDVPLLVRSGWADACDLVVQVDCEESVRRTRLAARGWSAAATAARELAWERGSAPGVALRKKIRRVDGSADPAYTRAQVGRVWNEVTAD